MTTGKTIALTTWTFVDKVMSLLFNMLSRKATATHSSTLAWKIPWTEEPGGPQSMGSLRIGQDSATSLSLFTFLHWRRKWQPTPVFLPGESHGWGAWWAAVCGVAESRTRLKRLGSSSSKISNNLLVSSDKLSGHIFLLLNGISIVLSNSLFL